MKARFFYWILIPLFVFACKPGNHEPAASPSQVQTKIPTPENGVVQDKPYLILISADGFRHDYATACNATNLLKLSKEGVAASALIPSFPSTTFANHYSIITGLYPSHHGIVDNYFHSNSLNDNFIQGASQTNGKWFGGTPLWVLAEQQGIKSASYMWLGSEATIKGKQPSLYLPFQKASAASGISQVIAWLELPEKDRPHFITLYLHDVDTETHLAGPEPNNAGLQVIEIDNQIKRLTEEVTKLGLKNVNYIFLSDHGMTRIEHSIPSPVIYKSEFTMPQWKPSGGLMVQLYANSATAAQREYYIKQAYEEYTKLPEPKHYSVYLKKNVPAYLHYGEVDDKYRCIGDIILIADKHYAFSYNGASHSTASHGYDPAGWTDMNATFYAWGPAFKKNLTIPAFKNVNVYPIVTSLLGLKITDPIDGTDDVAKKILEDVKP